jgi:diadenosine tetraphosphatase ApaH/serine/threonine PP2A family protein phosphatase
MIALISDIHGNLEALNQVFSWLDDKEPEEVHCLGDVVGYGASPLECVELVKARCQSYIRGNHEQGLLFYAEDFNPRAKAALDWTRDQINALARVKRRELWNLLDGTPETQSILGGEVLLVHGSPLDPIREYVLPGSAGDPGRMAGWFKAMGKHRICFLGHSHVPFVLFEDGQVVQPTGESYRLDLDNRRCLVNVGSVGQPRDSDPRASFVLLEDGTRLEYIRLSYDVQGAMKKIRAQEELPQALADRLEIGR